MSGSDNYWKRKVAGQGYSRRRVLGGAGVAAVGLGALGLVGCGDDDDDTEPTLSTGGTTTPATGGSPTAAASPDTAKPIDGGIYQGVWLGGSQFDSVDVHRNFRDETSWLSNYILKKVIRFSNPDTGELEGDIASKWETPDSQTYTFQLNKDIKWQDTPLTGGRALTSADVKWHMERQRDAKLADGTAAPFRFSSTYKDIKVETPDDYTLKVTLPAPNGSFFSQLAAYFSTVPNREATLKFEANHTVLTEEAMPASGPFTLKKWRANEDIHIAKNPLNNRKGEPHLDGMILPIGLFSDPAAYRLAFEQKQADGWSSPDPSLTKSVIDANKDTMRETLSGVANTVYLNLNMNQQFKDVRLVKAMNMAVDRRKMIQTFHQGLGQVSGPVSWLQEGYALKPDDLIKKPGYREDRDLEIKEARALWAAGGGPALGDIDIHFVDIWAANWPDTSQFLIKMFNDNLGVTQFKSTKATYNDDIIPLLAKGTFVNWMSWTSQVTSPDPRNELFQAFNSTANANWQHVNNPDLDPLLAEARITSDLAKGQDLTRKAQDIILDNGQYGNIILYNYISRSASWNYVHPNVKQLGEPGKPSTGYNIFAGHLTAKNVWINPKDPSYAASVGTRTV